MLTAILIIISYNYAWHYQLDAPLEVYNDVAHWEILKNHAADNAHGKRVLLIADSNALFGFDSDSATKALGFQVLNFGLHGGIPLNRILDIAVRKARSGDIVMLPLAWRYYVIDYRVPDDWYMDQLVVWDRDFLERISLPLKFQYMAAISPLKMLENIKAKKNRSKILRINPERAVHTPAQAMEIWRKDAWKQEEFKYSYLNMTARGDIRHACGVQYAAKSHDYFWLTPGKKPEPLSMDYLESVVHMLEDRGVDTYIVAPVMVDDETSRSTWMTDVIQSIWNEFRVRNIKTLGSADTFMFPASAFFDTSLHLNCESSGDRTQRLVSLLTSQKNFFKELK